jgi:hypothetical protein
MSTYTVLQALKQRHAGPATCQPGSCDACKALELADQAREALADLQERNSKNQYDQASFADVIRAGLGTMPR